MYKCLKFLWLLILVSGCGRESEVSVRSRVQGVCEELSEKYARLLDAGNDVDVLAEARLLAHDTEVSFWDWLFRDEGPSTPLQRALVIIDRDIDRLAQEAYRLERRALFGGLYDEVNRLRQLLILARRTMLASPELTQEGQFLEQRRLQRAQLSATWEQTRVIAAKD